MKKEEQEKDLGFGNTGSIENTRFINKGGDINVERKGLPFFRPYDLYHSLTNMNWGRFFVLVTISFFLINIFFACLYTLSENKALTLVGHTNLSQRFWDSFFFSVQTITTVGYGAISPATNLAKVISSVESFIGLLGFALVTGLLYGRFSKPATKIKYSENIIEAPFRDGRALMFKMANQSSSKLIEAEVTVVVSYQKEGNRLFDNLELQLNKINFFALSWTVVHPITEDSPFFNVTQKEIHKMDPEVIILVKAFDDSFAQTVYSRNSYKCDEFVWNAKFESSMLEEDGKLKIDLDKIDNYVLLT